jgi:hypothetical protein
MAKQTDISKLDRQIEQSVREFELSQLRRQQITGRERSDLLDQTLGRTASPAKDEGFAVGSSTVGITPKSIWFEGRRIHFAILTGIAVGERHTDGKVVCWVDINCTAHRSYRIRLKNILQTDAFLTALAQYTSFRIVPTIEEQMQEQAIADQIAAAGEERADQRARRAERIAWRQANLLENLVQVDSQILDLVTLTALF